MSIAGFSRRSRSRAALVALATAFVLPTAAYADDFGFDQLAKVVIEATSGAPAMVPFIERPTATETIIAGPPNAFGYLGSVSNPRVAYGKRGGASYYRAETDNKCNPDNFAFPPGQAGLQRINSSTFFKFDLKAGEITFKNAAKGDTIFTLTALQARILRRVAVSITDLREYTLDLRLLRRRVAQVSAEPECREFKYALTKVFEGKVSVTYYFEAGAEAGAQFDIANTINAKLGLAVLSQTGQSEDNPNALQFTSEPRIFAAKFRPVSELVGTSRVAGR